jgi:hypothetical protein
MRETANGNFEKFISNLLGDSVSRRRIAWLHLIEKKFFSNGKIKPENVEFDHVNVHRFIGQTRLVIRKTVIRSKKSFRRALAEEGHRLLVAICRQAKTKGIKVDFVRINQPFLEKRVVKEE